MSFLRAFYPPEYLKEVDARTAFYKSLMRPKDPPLVEVVNWRGDKILTSTPITEATKREVVQSFLPARMRGLKVTRGVSKLDREIANSFDVNEALAEALEQRAKAGLK